MDKLGMIKALILIKLLISLFELGLYFTRFVFQ